MQMRGDDSYGLSSLNGLIIFTDAGFDIKLIKLYDDRDKAGQTESWHTLVYEGKGNLKSANGIWYYLGF